ncbi:MAG: hypothetical protein NVSMB38_45090 [Ktedonobacteraceae bacterium]
MTQYKHGGFNDGRERNQRNRARGRGRGTLTYGWLDIAEVLMTLRNRSPTLHVVLTGRDAPKSLIEYADLVTEMREIKHPYKTQGIMAQKGLDF